jgi:hypothetical protein
MKKKNISIAFWGSPPPPIGGMTVHIQRFSSLLISEGVKVIMYNFSKEKSVIDNVKNVNSILMWYLSLIFLKSPKIHYVITTNSKVRFLATMLSIIRLKKVIIRVGGHSLKNSINRGGLDKYLNIVALKLCFGFIGVNKEICDIAVQYTSKNKVNHIPGFLPPVNIETPPQIPIEIDEFFNSVDVKIVVTGQIVFKEEDDLYGLWDVLDFIEELKESNKKVRCCIVSYSYLHDNFEERKQFNEEIVNRKLNENVFVYHNLGELWPIINTADVFIRPSYTDGDANSIREALFLNKIVIASNSVERPSKCILYETGNTKDLVEKVKTVLSQNYVRDSECDDLGNYNKLKKLIQIV